MRSKTKTIKKQRLVRWIRPLGWIIAPGLLTGALVGLKLGWEELKASEFFQIKSIEVIGAKKVGKEEILFLSHIKPGMGIFDFDLGEVVKSIEEHPWVKKAMVSRQLPEQVIIAVEEEEPIAIMILDEPYYLNSELKLFKKVVPKDELDYPVFTGLGLKEMSGNDEQSLELLKEGLLLWSLLEKSKLFPKGQISEVNLSPELGISLNLEMGPVIILGENGMEAKFYKLEQIRKELGERFFWLREIDLSKLGRVVARFYQSEQGLEEAPVNIGAD